MAFKQWQHYLEGAAHTITVITDHANLCSFMSTKELSRQQARWWELMSGYSFEVTYRGGKANPADPPSRRSDYEKESRDRPPPQTDSPRCAPWPTGIMATIPAEAIFQNRPERDLARATRNKRAYPDPTQPFREAVVEAQWSDSEASALRTCCGRYLRYHNTVWCSSKIVRRVGTRWRGVSRIGSGSTR
jgi:hypothetical protein